MKYVLLVVAIAFLGYELFSLGSTIVKRVKAKKETKIENNEEENLNEEK